MTCTSCGAELRPGAMFCGECGTRVSQPVAYAPAQSQPTVPLQPLIWSSDPGDPAPVPAASVAPVAPVVEPVATPSPVPPAPRALTIDDLEATILAPRRRPWVITGPDGVAHPIRVPTVIGRAPQRPADRREAEVLPLVDPTKSLSKSHALLELDGSGFTIRDLGSTNGIVIVDDEGVEHMLPVGVPVPVEAGTRFELGDYILVIDHA